MYTNLQYKLNFKNMYTNLQYKLKQSTRQSCHYGQKCVRYDKIRCPWQLALKPEVDLSGA